MNLFDDLESDVFRITTDVFGYEASWTPYLTGIPVLALNKVHFKDPNKKNDEVEYEKIDFASKDPYIEYFFPDWEGLYEVGRTGQARKEIITIQLPTGPQNFSVRDVAKIWDGRTYRVTLHILISP